MATIQNRPQKVEDHSINPISNCTINTMFNADKENRSKLVKKVKMGPQIASSPFNIKSKGIEAAPTLSSINESLMATDLSVIEFNLPILPSIDSSNCLIQ